MVRLVYTSLILSFTPSDSSPTTRPTATQAAAIVTHYYKLSYNYIYSHEKYSADESTDIDSIIDTDGFRSALQVELQTYFEDYHQAGTTSQGTVRKFPRMDLSEDFKKEIDLMIGKDEDIPSIDNIRFGGSDQTDWELIP